MPLNNAWKQPVLVVLTGLPAAGKTTLAGQLGPELDGKSGLPVITIASDTVRAEITSLQRRFHPELEPAVRRMTLDRISSALEQGFSVIHDDLNYYRSMRFDLVQLARDAKVPHALIHVSTDQSTCLEHNAARGRKVPDEVIIQDAERFDAPGLDPWDEPLASLQGPPYPGDLIASLIDRLADLCEGYEPWSEAAPPIHVTSQAETMDLLARQVVASLYKVKGRPVDGRAVSRNRRQVVEQATRQQLSEEEATALFRKELGALFE